MFLLGLFFTICALIILFDIIMDILVKRKVVDLAKNEGLQKAVNFTKKLVHPVYDKCKEIIPEKYRVFSGYDFVPWYLLIVLSILGQWMM